MGKIKFFITNNPAPIIISIILIALYVYHEDSFFIVLLSYGLFIYFLTSKYNKGKVKKYLRRVIWTTFIIIFVLGFYVNHYLPHGPSYPTGDYVCQYDDRGSCGKEYKEDMSKLDIPDWAKFLKSSAGLLLLFGLVFAGIFTRKAKDDDEK